MGWKVGTWSGLPNYECTDCVFATTSQDAIEDHVYSKHGVYPADVRRELEAQALADQKNKDELIELAEKAGADTSGTKAEIAARIVGADPKEMNDGN